MLFKSHYICIDVIVKAANNKQNVYWNNISGSFYKFPDIFLLAFKIVVDT